MRYLASRVKTWGVRCGASGNGISKNCSIIASTLRREARKCEACRKQGSMAPRVLGNQLSDRLRSTTAKKGYTEPGFYSCRSLVVLPDLRYWAPYQTCIDRQIFIDRQIDSSILKSASFSEPYLFRNIIYNEIFFKPHTFLWILNLINITLSV